jgi:hypothetical protein
VRTQTKGRRREGTGEGGARECRREEGRKRRDNVMTMEVSIDPLYTNQSLLMDLVNVVIAFTITGHI